MNIFGQKKWGRFNHKLPLQVVVCDCGRKFSIMRESKPHLPIEKQIENIKSKYSHCWWN